MRPSPGPSHESAQTLAADAAWPGAASAAFSHLSADLTRPMTLPLLADELGIAARTFQRLLHTDKPIAEIGFVCGYADQPHVTR